MKGKLLEVDKTIKGVEAAVSMETLIEQVHKIKADARNAILEANDKDFTLAGKVIGKKAIYEGMQQEALSYGIKNILTRAQTKNTNQATENLKSSKLNIEEQTRVLTLSLSKMHEEIWKIDNETALIELARKKISAEIEELGLDNDVIHRTIDELSKLVGTLWMGKKIAK